MGRDFSNQNKWKSFYGFFQELLVELDSTRERNDDLSYANQVCIDFIFVVPCFEEIFFTLKSNAYDTIILVANCFNSNIK